MPPTNITPEQILDAIHRIPAERWDELLQAIERLQTRRPSESSKSSIQTGTDLQASDLIGIWADRADIGNGHDFARQLRRQAEQRQ
jgi:hypothetical protein